jgi:hypothetical protein
LVVLMMLAVKIRLHHQRRRHRVHQAGLKRQVHLLQILL